MSTKIEWCEETWNPITGCTPCSPGCAHCYAKRMATRLKGRFGYPADDPFRVAFHPDRLTQPLKWKKPRRIFVCSMGDLFHEDVTFEQIQDIYCYMAVAQQHTFLILTKRPRRMAEFYRRCEIPKPNKHIWLGVTVCNQAEAWKVGKLLEVPAAVHFVSHGPALGEVDWGPYLPHPESWAWEVSEAWGRNAPTIDLLITEGESGTGARPMHPDIPRSDRDQCQSSGTAFFFKQWGEYVESVPSNIESAKSHLITDDCSYFRIGTKKAGRLLDGREWREWPE